MKVIAYAARRYKAATEKSIRGYGVVLTCPPMHDGTFTNSPKLLSGWDVVVFNLHGLPGSPVWLGGDGADDGVSALRATTLSNLNLAGCGVFAINCFLDDNHPMLLALRDAGCAWVIGGEGENYGGRTEMLGADVLLKWFLVCLNRLKSPDHALRIAKVMTAILAPATGALQVKARNDALRFRIKHL